MYSKNYTMQIKSVMVDVAINENGRMTYEVTSSFYNNDLPTNCATDKDVFLVAGGRGVTVNCIKTMTVLQCKMYLIGKIFLRF
jgi:hypothetical protein